MLKHDYATYLRGRKLLTAEENAKKMGVPKKMLMKFINEMSDDYTIDSYRTCGDCGKEFLTADEMARLIEKYDDPEKIFEEFDTVAGKKRKRC